MSLFSTTQRSVSSSALVIVCVCVHPHGQAHAREWAQVTTESHPQFHLIILFWTHIMFLFSINWQSYCLNNIKLVPFFHVQSLIKSCYKVSHISKGSFPVNPAFDWSRITQSNPLARVNIIFVFAILFKLFYITILFHFHPSSVLRSEHFPFWGHFSKKQMKHNKNKETRKQENAAAETTTSLQHLRKTHACQQLSQLLNWGNMGSL